MHHSHHPKYKLTTSNGGINGFYHIELIIENNGNTKITAYGDGNHKFEKNEIFKGRESWQTCIQYAYNQIQANNLTGTWLDTCKLKIVYWKAKDITMKNIEIEVIDAPDEKVIF